MVFGICLILASVADPSIVVGRDRLSSGHIVLWSQQTTQQRMAHLVSPGIPALAMTLLPLVYFWSGSDDQRNPLTFDKQLGELRKGTKVLAKLPTAKCVAVVFITYPSIRWRRFESTGQVFLRFSAEPWSVQINSYPNRETTDRVANLVADYLAIPVIVDPIIVRSASYSRGYRRNYK